MIGPSAEVLRWAEEVHRLNGIYDAWAESAAQQGIEIALPAMPVRPVEPTIAEAARALSDNADEDLGEAGEGPQ